MRRPKKFMISLGKVTKTHKVKEILKRMMMVLLGTPTQKATIHLQTQKNNNKANIIAIITATFIPKMIFIDIIRGLTPKTQRNSGRNRR